MTARIDPIRPTDDEARAEARALLRNASGMLATLALDGSPHASLVLLAPDRDGTPITLVSQLSAHARHLDADPRASLLCAATGKGDPLAHPRVSLKARGRRIARGSDEHARIRARFLRFNPKAQLYVDFPDFSFWRLEPLEASLNGGFGRAFNLTAADVAVAPADDDRE